ncbi:hypothetical protein DXG01_016264 [Tephrocybe rancida]|nr:hypothetical protein DXG01_016264 [Tephrocybe rancida]
MFTAKDPRTQELFVDDALTEIELNLISGTYACHTGSGSQLAMRSWFPSFTTFELSGEDYGRWTAHREDSYFRRLDEINNIKHEASSRGPLNAKKWRDLMRGGKELCRLKDTIEMWSKEFLEEHLGL